MYKVLIRADGSSSIGLGHIMRCISLAKMFSQKGYEVFFLSRYKEGIEVITENGFNVISLSAGENRNELSLGFSYGSHSELDTEKNEIISTLRKYKIDILVIDHYNVTQDYFYSLKPYVDILTYIDDMNAFPYPVDLLINGNITGNYMDYVPFYKGQRFLLGPAFNLIRDEFKNLPNRKFNKEVKKIFVSTGGADPFGNTERLIDLLRSENTLNEIDLHVIIGNGFRNKKRIKSRQERYSNIVCYENIRKISNVMLDCDIALSSCGSTLYELCACGLPTLGFIVADNQVFMSEKMNELGYIKNLGWYHQLDQEYVISSLKNFIFDFKAREQMKIKQKTLVDGKGTERIVAVITKMIDEKKGVMHE